MKKLSYLFAVIAIVSLCGCTTVMSTTNFKTMTIGEDRKQPVAHVHVRISGFYLFGFIPIMCGSRAGDGKTSFFQDNCNVETVVNLACKEARGEGGNNILNLVTDFTEVNFLLWSNRYISASASAIQ